MLKIILITRHMALYTHALHHAILSVQAPVCLELSYLQHYEVFYTITCKYLLPSTVELTATSPSLIKVRCRTILRSPLALSPAHQKTKDLSLLILPTFPRWPLCSWTPLYSLPTLTDSHYNCGECLLFHKVQAVHYRLSLDQHRKLNRKGCTSECDVLEQSGRNLGVHLATANEV